MFFRAVLRMCGSQGGRGGVAGLDWRVREIISSLCRGYLCCLCKCLHNRPCLATAAVVMLAGSILVFVGLLLAALRIGVYTCITIGGV